MKNVLEACYLLAVSARFSWGFKSFHSIEQHRHKFTCASLAGQLGSVHIS